MYCRIILTLTLASAWALVACGQASNELYDAVFSSNGVEMEPEETRNALGKIYSAYLEEIRDRTSNDVNQAISRMDLAKKLYLLGKIHVNQCAPFNLRELLAHMVEENSPSIERYLDHFGNGIMKLCEPYLERSIRGAVSRLDIDQESLDALYKSVEEAKSGGGSGYTTGIMDFLESQVGPFEYPVENSTAFDDHYFELVLEPCMKVDERLKPAILVYNDMALSTKLSERLNDWTREWADKWRLCHVVGMGYSYGSDLVEKIWRAIETKYAHNIPEEVDDDDDDDEPPKKKTFMGKLKKCFECLLPK